jgi:type I restriction enzyme S subunit
VRGNGSKPLVGRGGIVQEDAEIAFPDTLIRIRFDETKARPKYVALIWDAPPVRAQIQSAARTTAGIYKISQKDLREIRIALPPIDQQSRIAAAIEEQLSRLDAGVIALARARQSLHRMRAAAIQSAVTGNLVPQSPHDGTGADVLAAIEITRRTKSRRNATPLTTILPSLPPSWATAPWASIGYSQNGRAFPSTDYSTTGRKLLRPGNLYGSGEVGWTTANTRCLPERYAEDFPEYLVHPGDIVMNLTAQSLKDEFLGRTCMTSRNEEPVLLNQRIAKLTPVGMNPRFVFYVFKSRIFRRFVDQLNTGSLIQHMFTSQLDQFTLPIPPREEQERIVCKIDEIIILFNYIEDAITKADKRAPALRAAILEAAFLGKIAAERVSA